MHTDLMDAMDPMNTDAPPVQQGSSALSTKAVWVKPTISKLETVSTAGDAKASKGNEATAQGPS
jgi:hypothetical protein